MGPWPAPSSTALTPPGCAPLPHPGSASRFLRSACSSRTPPTWAPCGPRSRMQARGTHRLAGPASHSAGVPLQGLFCIPSSSMLGAEQRGRRDPTHPAPPTKAARGSLARSQRLRLLGWGMGLLQRVAQLPPAPCPVAWAFGVSRSLCPSPTQAGLLDLEGLGTGGGAATLLGPAPGLPVQEPPGSTCEIWAWTQDKS